MWQSFFECSVSWSASTVDLQACVEAGQFGQGFGQVALAFAVIATGLWAVYRLRDNNKLASLRIILERWDKFYQFDMHFTEQARIQLEYNFFDGPARVIEQYFKNPYSLTDQQKKRTCKDRRIHEFPGASCLHK